MKDGWEGQGGESSALGTNSHSEPPGSLCKVGGGVDDTLTPPVRVTWLFQAESTPCNKWLFKSTRRGCTVTLKDCYISSNSGLHPHEASSSLGRGSWIRMNVPCSPACLRWAFHWLQRHGLIKRVVFLLPVPALPVGKRSSRLPRWSRNDVQEVTARSLPPDVAVSEISRIESHFLDCVTKTRALFKADTPEYQPSSEPSSPPEGMEVDVCSGHTVC